MLGIGQSFRSLVVCIFAAHIMSVVADASANWTAAEARGQICCFPYSQFTSYFDTVIVPEIGHDQGVYYFDFDRQAERYDYTGTINGAQQNYEVLVLYDDNRYYKWNVRTRSCEESRPVNQLDKQVCLGDTSWTLAKDDYAGNADVERWNIDKNPMTLTIETDSCLHIKSEIVEPKYHNNTVLTVFYKTVPGVPDDIFEPHKECVDAFRPISTNTTVNQAPTPHASDQSRMNSTSSAWIVILFVGGVVVVAAGIRLAYMKLRSPDHQPLDDNI